jgi:hypothetical protein
MATDKALREVRREQAKDRRAGKEQQLRQRERVQRALDATNEERAVTIRKHNAVVTGMVPRIAGAIDSWVGHRVPLSVVHPAFSFSAATDFHAISINIPEQDVDLDFAADLRGLAYHEAGHILKSMPFPVLLNHVLPDAPPVQQRKFMDKVCGVPQDTMHHAWNCLEDQRMETAMTHESSNLGRYYNVIVLTHVLANMSPNSYFLLHGRKHVDETVRQAAWKMAVETHGAPMVEEAEALIDQYMRTDDPFVMWDAVVRFGRIVKGLSGDFEGSVDGHNFLPDNRDADDFDLDESADSDEEQDEADGGAQGGDEDEDAPGSKGRGGDDEADDEDDDDEPGQAGDVADRQAHGERDDEPDMQGASNSVNDPDWTRDLVKRALEEAREERRLDQQIVRDLRAYNEALHDNRDSLPLERIPYTVDPDPDVTAQAVRLNRALRNLMEQARAQTAPAWQTGQRRGTLDVRAYITRQPGDVEFFRDYAEGGDMHLPDMAVSVLLDGSGSMDHAAQALAIAAFGIKSACDVVNVPCTVTVYDTDAYLLWDESDTPLDVPYNIVPCGGTDPTRALDLIDLQKHGKKNHLVIIMTDGAWSGGWHGTKSLAHYQSPDRDMVMFFYKTTPTYGPNGTDQCSAAVQIDDLQDMPRFLMRYLTRAM